MNVFGFNGTDKREGDTIYADGKRFMTAQIDGATVNEYGALLRGIDEAYKQPQMMSAIKSISASLALCLFAFFLYHMEVFYVENLFTRAILPKICFVVCLLLWLIFGIAVKKRMRESAANPELEKKKERLDELTAQIKERLEIPDGAERVDVLYYPYKVTNEKEHMASLGYFNMPNFVFVKDDMLCLANMTDKFSFPLDGIAGISEVSKKIPLLTWNKEKAYNDKQYKRYKIIRNNIGVYWCKPYYLLQVSEGYEIMIMPYDLCAYEKLIPNFRKLLSGSALEKEKGL